MGIDRVGTRVSTINQLREQVSRLAKASPTMRASLNVLKRRGATALSPHRNLYHCCTQKTASQWFRRMFTSALFFDYTGLYTVPYRGQEDAFGLGLRFVKEIGQFPRNSVVAHLYVDRDTYDAVPKPPTYRTFFVLRDPRDIVVSWYFHAQSRTAGDIGPIPEMRSALVDMDKEQGMRYVIDQVASWGTFDAQSSWLAAGESPGLAIFRYEDLVADNTAFTAKLFDHLDVEMPEDRFEQLMDRFSFERLSGGRTPGQEDVHSHYRKGISGDWANHFTSGIAEHFVEVTGDAATAIGYSW